MKISNFITKTLMDLLDEKRIVVWYYASGDIRGFRDSFKAAKCKVVTAESSLAARRAVDDIYVKIMQVVTWPRLQPTCLSTCRAGVKPTLKSDRRTRSSSMRS